MNKTLMMHVSANNKRVKIFAIGLASTQTMKLIA